MPITITITLYKESKDSYVKDRCADPDDMDFCKRMFKSIRYVMPKAKEPNFEKWANTIRLMRERDSLTLNEIERVFNWANQDDFWRVNICSPDKLRKQFAVLHAKSQESKPKGDVYDPCAGVMI